MGSDCVIRFENKQKEIFNVYLERKSLIVFSGEAYCECMHSIENMTEDVIKLEIDDSDVEEKVKVVKSNVINIHLM